jgi:Na+-transporting NADH:ubiquinone oxidoreductase subunit A
MTATHLKKGFSLRIAGAPTLQVRQLEAPRQVGMVPEFIPFVRPRLLVQEGDAVAIGTPLFEDKRDTRIRFVSPGGGRVSRIVFGPRRIIRQIVVSLDDDEGHAPLDVPAAGQLGVTPRPALVACLLAGGMWPFLRALPFMDLADPDVDPPAIIVRLGDDEPFGPDPVVYLNGKQDSFATGIELLKRLCDRVVIHINGDEAIQASLPDAVPVNWFTGTYPCGNPSVQVYRTKTGPELNRSWFIDGQEVVLLGEFSGRQLQLLTAGAQIPRHLVESIHEAADFVVHGLAVDRDRQVPFSHPPGTVGQIHDRYGDGFGQVETKPDCAEND